MGIALVSACVLTPHQEILRATVILEAIRIAPGFEADLVGLDDGLEVAMTFVTGELAFRWPKGSAVLAASPLLVHACSLAPPSAIVMTAAAVRLFCQRG